MNAGQLDAAESSVKILEKAAEGDESIKGDVANLQALIAWRREDFTLAEELAQKALSLLPPDELEKRGSLIVVLGFIQTSRGNLEEAESLLTEGCDILRQVGDNQLLFTALSFLAMIVANKGKLRQAAEMYRQVIELAGASPAASVSHLLLSVALYEWNDLEAAENHVQHAIELARLLGYPERLARAHNQLANIRLARGDENGALEAMENADIVAQKLKALPSFQAEHAAAHILMALRQDNLATALEWGEKLARDLGSLTNWYYLHVPAYLLIAQGQKPVAAEKLQALYEKLVQSGNLIYIIRVRMYQAMAADTEESALEFLADALAIAEPEGGIRIFADEGKLLAPLLRKAITQGIMPEYAGKLLTIIEAEERRKRQKTTTGETLLSERELEILKLLAADVSNQQIAERLTISLGTVKTHVHHILEKLNAKDRSQAVFYARELKLI